MQDFDFLKPLGLLEFEKKVLRRFFDVYGSKLARTPKKSWMVGVLYRYGPKSVVFLVAHVVPPRPSPAPGRDTYAKTLTHLTFASACWVGRDLYIL